MCFSSCEEISQSCIQNIYIKIFNIEGEKPSFESQVPKKGYSYFQELILLNRFVLKLQKLT